MAENVLFRWLHISDLHTFAILENEFMLRAYQDLAQQFRPNFLLVTGDFRHLNTKGASFETGLRYLNQIVDIFGLEKKDVFLVPGNHDVKDSQERNAFIGNIRFRMETEPDLYRQYGHGNTGDLYLGFAEYIEFARNFYGTALSENDPRWSRPADVFHCVWNDRVNLVCLNTSLIADRESYRPQIYDLEGFAALEIDNDLPTLVLGHHGIDRMEEYFKTRTLRILIDHRVGAYLCGDSHKAHEHSFPRPDDRSRNILQYTCGKSAPENGDDYSDLSAIGYECRSDGKAYVQLFLYPKATEKALPTFRNDPKFDTSGGAKGSFPMFDPDSPPASYGVILASTPTFGKDSVGSSAVTNDVLSDWGLYDDYKSYWEMVGRRSECQKLIQKLKQKKTQMYWVTGVAGLGKTELCKEVGRRMRQVNNGWSMPYVKLADVNSYASFLTALARALGGRLSDQQDQWENDIRRLLQLHEDNRGLPMPLVLYFDNFEDVVDSEKTDREKIYCLLLELSQRYHLLFSTQKLPNTPRMVDTDLVFPLKLLSWEGEGLDNKAFLRLESAKLFCRIWGRKPGNKTEWKHFRTLITEIQGHPLAIVLTAHMARNDILGLNYVVDHWPQASQDIPREGERHISLDKSLQLAWNGVKDHPAAVRYWSLQYYSILPIPTYLHSRLEIGLAAGELQEGIRALSQYHLLTKEGSGISMLSPIRKQLPELLADPSVLEKGLLTWARALPALLKEANARGSERRDAAHLEVLSLMPQLLHVLEKLADLGEAQFPLLRSLAGATRNYYQYYMPSAETLAKLLSLPITKTDSSFYAFLHGYSGDLQSRLGQPEKAMKLYEQAEVLYRKVQDDRGLANTLQSMGDLQSLLGEPDKAMKLYEQAEALYRKEQHGLGLANTLQSMGYLQSRLGQLEKAMKLYEQAEALYRKEQVDLGLANTLQSMGDLQRRLGQPDKAMKLYEQAEGLYRKEQDDLGLANTLKSMGDLQHLLGQPEKAMELYKQAEALYRKEQDDLGFANTLQSMGYLQYLLGEPGKAMKLYEQAEGLYQKEQDDLGLANTLRSMGDLQRLSGEPEKVMKLYEQAEALFRKEQSDLGLANTLKSMGDLQHLLGQPEKAMELYEQAEALYRKEQDDLGFANTLQSMGYLQYLLGEPGKAMKLYEQAEGLYRKEQDDLGLANTLISMGDLRRRLGEPDKAMKLYEQAEGLYRKEQSDLGLANTLRSMGDLQSRLGEPEKAMELYKQAEELYRKEQDDLGLANTLLSMGDLQRLSGEPEKAMKLYEQAEGLYRKEQVPMGLANVLLEQAGLHIKKGKKQAAREKAEEALGLSEPMHYSHGIDMANLILKKLQ